MANTANITIEMMLKEAKLLGKKIAATPTGEHRKNGQNPREFRYLLNSSKKRERWVALADLRSGRNPFNLLTLAERKEEITLICKNIGAEFTGVVIEESGKDALFEVRKGDITRLVTLSNARKPGFKMSYRTEDAQIKAVKAACKKIGAKFSRILEPRNNVNYFLITKGDREREVTLGNLEKDCDPFDRPTPEESLVELEKILKKLTKGDVWATGKHGARRRNTIRKKGDNHIFFEVTNGKRFTWVDLPHARAWAVSPFYKASTADLQKEFNGLMKKMGYVSLNKYKKVKYGNAPKGNGHLLFAATDGNIIGWQTIASARRGCDLFHPTGGFRPSKPGYVYILKLLTRTGDVYTGYGITNNLERRFKDHELTFRRHGITCLETKTYYFANGMRAQETEQDITAYLHDAKQHHSLKGVSGFIRECAIGEAFDEVMFIAEEAKGSRKTLNKTANKQLAA